MPIRIVSRDPNYVYNRYKIKSDSLPNPNNDIVKEPQDLAKSAEKKPYQKPNTKKGRYQFYNYRGIQYGVELDSDYSRFQENAQKQRDIIAQYHHTFKNERKNLKEYNTFYTANIVVPTKLARPLMRGQLGPWTIKYIENNDKTTRFQISNVMGDFTALEVFRFFNQFGIVKVDAPRLRYVNPYLKKQYDQDQQEQNALKKEDAKRVYVNLPPRNENKIRKDW